MTKHTILFVAANPAGTDLRALDREARAIHMELERSGFRNRFELVTRCAADPLDLLRALRKLEPTVVHFSGPQLVSTKALQDTFGAAGSSVKLVVLSGCYSEPQAAALLADVDCVVGVRGAIGEAAARAFAIGFYGGLGEREAVAVAYQQGCAAIGLEGQAGERPQLQVRTGVDAARLVLADSTNQRTERARRSPETRRAAGDRTTSATTRERHVDIGILTIRPDEFNAVLAAFPDEAGSHEGAHRIYTLRHADAGRGARYTLAILRQNEQGNGEAQEAARDLIEDLAPRLVLVVGIAGGFPSDDLKLGDVVVSTRIQDFTVEARSARAQPTYAATGGPITKALVARVTNLAGRDAELGDWTAKLPAQPSVSWTRKGQLYGPSNWQRHLKTKLARHYGHGGSPRGPIYAAGTIASSDKLVKDVKPVLPWLASSRDILAVEMEAGGVYRAARERCPMLAIRGISDIVGLKRADDWTKYACASAAAFTRAFLCTRPAGDP